MRVVFIGASRFGLRCLELVHSLGECELVGVVTAPKRFRISYSPEGVRNVLHRDVTGFARKHGVPWVRVIAGMRDQGLFETVRGWNPDAFLVAGWYHMVPRDWRALAPAYGLHASLLPDYSGGAPLVWAIINGEERTGITLFELSDGVDDGPIIGQAATRISRDDSILTLYGRIETLGLELISEFFPLIARGEASRLQQDSSKRRVFPQRAPADGLLDWDQPATRIHDFVRAQTRPYPGAFSFIAGQKIHIWAGCPLTDGVVVLGPGEVQVNGSLVVVGCGDGRAFRIDEATVAHTDQDLGNWLPRRPGVTYWFDTLEGRVMR